MATTALKPLTLFFAVWILAPAHWLPVVYAQAESAETGSRSRRELIRTRRVGHLKRQRGRSRAFQITDVWSHEAYEVVAGKGLDLEPYLDRYIALHGKMLPDDRGDGLPQFRADKVIDLDTRRRSKPAAVARSVAQVDHEEVIPARALQIDLPSEALGGPDTVEAPDFLGEVIEVPAPLATEGGLIEPTMDPLLSDLPYGVGPDSLPAGGGVCGPGESIWIRAEYLWWWTDSLRLPALVTSSPAGTPRTEAGVLGFPATTVLNPIAVNNDAHAGMRFRGGFWLDGARGLGLGADYYGMNHQAAGFSANSAGAPILARPFFDAANARETAELVAFPGVISGTVALDARTEFQSIGGHVLLNLCCGDWSNPCNRNGSRVDAIIGYRHARLRDNLVISENLTSQDPANPGSFEIRDYFDTVNEFHGGEIGVVYYRRMGSLMIEGLSKVAVGNNHQVVSIDGRTRIRSTGVDTTLPGGLLAQRTNMGRFARDELAVLPELGFTVGYQVTPRLAVTFGYTLVYFSNVVRAGDQVDLDLNPNLLPPEAVPFVGPDRPAFAFRQTDFWAHGFSVGGDFRW